MVPSQKKKNMNTFIFKMRGQFRKMSPTEKLRREFWGSWFNTNNNISDSSSVALQNSRNATQKARQGTTGDSSIPQRTGEECQRWDQQSSPTTILKYLNTRMQGWSRTTAGIPTQEILRHGAITTDSATRYEECNPATAANKLYWGNGLNRVIILPKGLFRIREFTDSTWYKWLLISTDLLHMEKFHFEHLRIITAKVLDVLHEYLLFDLL